MFFVTSSTKTIQVFIVHSNSRDDKNLRDKLENHLTTLQNRVNINWYKSQTLSGKDWNQESYRYFNISDVIVLLVSPDFIASSDCQKITKLAMKMDKAGKVRVIPVKMRRIDNWQGQSFGKLESLPSNGEPVTSKIWRRLDDAFVDIVEKIRLVVEDIEQHLQQKQLIREQQRAAMVEAITSFIANQSSVQVIRTFGIGISLILVVVFLSFCRTSPNIQLEKLLTQGQTKFAKSDYQGAIEDYTKVIKIDSKNLDAYIGRGNARSYLKNYKAAIEDYTRVINLEPEYADVYMNRAVISCKLGDKQRAIKDYQKAANLYAKKGATHESQEAISRLRNLKQCLPRSSK